VVGGAYDLTMRYLLSRDSVGSIYLGVCGQVAPFGEPTPPFTVVCVWDVPSKQLRLSEAGGQVQVEGGTGGIFPAESHLPVILDRATGPTTHLGYTLYGVEGRPGLRYCPSLEIAFIYSDKSPEGMRELVIQAITRGEPSLEAYGLTP
jgi:hypothetical protein